MQAAANASVVYAFAAGLLSFLSPCVLPLVPGYVSLLSGGITQNLPGEGQAAPQPGGGGVAVATSTEAGSRVAVRHARGVLIANSIFFILGFSLVFIALGATATSVGQALRTHQELFSEIGGIIVILFGLHLLGVVRISALYGDKRVHKKISVSSGLGAFVVGFTFAFGWTPCIGPMLATILLLAANVGTVSHGIFLLAVYSAGLAVPFLLTTLAIDRFATFYKGFRQHLGTVERISGVLLLLIGALLLTHRFTMISGYLAQIPFFNKLML
ncbi:MAG: cytochrome c biogenesis protein CcdA [Acidobacteria bacterium]|nr:MAG: cytochrome c biogenesis protein CcdA [Acidobacteriota bacterium]